MDNNEINKRYSQLAESTCCLSCGGAIEFGRPKPGEVCIDLGCGRGTDAIRMAESVGEEGHVIGIDISDGMLAKAKSSAEKLEIKNISFIKSELEELKLDSSIADLVISNCTINHATDKSAVWQEIYRVLKKGGRFAVSDIYSLEEVPEEFKNDPAAVAECWAGAIKKDEYINTLINAGFSGIQILEESKPYEKGKIIVASFTIAGQKPSGCCCCKN